MSDLVVIVPSRGRLEQAEALVRVFADTCTADTRLVFAVDDDGPVDYAPLISHDRVHVNTGPSRTMVQALNRAAAGLAVDADPPFAIGFMGDDHCPRTYGWDQAYLDTLREMGTGIVYGNDLLQGERLPTQVAMTTDIVRALGYMSPPELRHMYVDNFWLQLGQYAGCIRYLPDVIVEHRHPLAGKAQWDEGYVRVNDAAVYEADEQAFAEYGRTRFREDVTAVRLLRG